MFQAMLRRMTPALAGLLFLAPIAPAHSQTVVRQIGDDVKHVGEDMWRVWSSPVRGSGRDWLTAGLVIAGAAAISPLDDNIDRWVVSDSARGVFKSLKEVRRGGKLFGGSILVPPMAGVLVIGYATGNQDLRDAAWGCGASFAANSVARNQVLYRLFARTRPDSSKDNPPYPPGAREGDQYDIGMFPKDWGRESFPGGHIANIASCASFLANRFNLGVAEPALYALIAAVGVGRIADRAHWMSDQVVGAALGYAIGREIALRQNKRREAARRAELAKTPTVSSHPRPAGEGFFLGTGPHGATQIGWQKTF